jgi:hypothetical protein
MQSVPITQAPRLPFGGGLKLPKNRGSHWGDHVLPLEMCRATYSIKEKTCNELVRICGLDKVEWENN